MSVHGIGIDVADVARWRTLGLRDRVTARWFDADETHHCRTASDPARAWAETFAAKEAAWKALSPDGWDGRVPWGAVGIVRDGHDGHAHVRWSGRLSDIARERHCVVEMHSTERVAMARAVCVTRESALVSPTVSVTTRARERAASIIVPAHNEAAVLARTLAPLAAAAAAGRLEVIVVCNACTDNTADVAASFEGVSVLISPIPSKARALNLGDDHASHWPRIYLDADIVATEDALVTTAAALNDEVLAARPLARFDTSGASAIVAAYYRARARIPSFSTALWGAGVYGLSETGHRRLGRFPDLKGDDLWVDRLFSPEQKRVIATHSVAVRVPRTVNALLAITRRSVSGARERGPLAQTAHDPGGTVRQLFGAVRSPRSALDALTYVGIAVVARLGLLGGERGWERDDSSRV